MDKKFMKEALRQAKMAAAAGDVPVGAVIVHGGLVISRARNMREVRHDATLHAEISAISKASRKLGRWNLSDCDIYVTLEPCAMCAGAIVNARIKNVFFGAYDKRFGCCGSNINIASSDFLNHRAAVLGGIMEDECAGLMRSFFESLREAKKERAEAAYLPE